MKEALFYEKGKEDSVRCHLCHHRCVIGLGQRGLCGVRENRDGVLLSLVYGQLVAENVDPVEKKPLYHFQPGTRSYSISTVGCNFKCLHCQNHHISQYPMEHNGAIAGRARTPDDIVSAAGRKQCASISYTYVEPTIFYEFTKDCSELAHKNNMKNIYVSNGYMCPEVTRELASFIDGINIDIKSMSEQFYHNVCKARLQPVLDNVKLFYTLGVWLEVTTLIIPGLNDGEEELRQVATFIADIDPNIPWHISAFYPTYKMMDRSPTTIEHLNLAFRVGKDVGLHYVYMGNVAGAGATTYCPGCGSPVVERSGFDIENRGLRDGRCLECNAVIAGRWS